MTSPAPTRQVLTIDPDGVPVALVDIAGDTIDGTLWGAVRAGGAVALVVTEDDRSDFYVRDKPGNPPTVDAMLALADALTDDPENPHHIENTRLWWIEEAARLRTARDSALARADQLAADVERMQRSVRDYAADDEDAREGYTRVLGDLNRANEIIAEQAARADRAERKLLTLKHSNGALSLARAAVQVTERERAAAAVDRATTAGNVRAIRAAAAAALAGLAAGFLIGRNR